MIGVGNDMQMHLYVKVQRKLIKLQHFKFK